MREKIYSVLTGAALLEYVLLEALAAGRWRKLNAKLLVTRHASSRQLTAAGVTLDHPGEGGLFLWGSVPAEVDLNLLVQDAYRNKILLVRGSTFRSARLLIHTYVSMSPSASNRAWPTICANVCSL